MRKMKDSGVEWIGEIPEEWNLLPTKRFFRSEKRVVGSAVGDYERLALTMQGVIKRSKDDSEGLQPEKFEGYQILRKNELVFKLIDLENVKTSRVGLSPYTGLVSPAYIVLTNDQKDKRFFYYWFMFMYYNEVYNRLGGAGVRSALNAKDVCALPIPAINYDIQKKIADYLDKKCAKIDAVIAKQEQIIEKLEEYKNCVIAEAVTRGLDKGIELINSENKWIGMIPRDWSIGKLGSLFDFLGGYAFSSDDYVDETDYQVVRIGNVKNDSILLDSNPVYISREIAKTAKRFALRPGYVLFSMTGTKGKRDYFYTCMVKDEDVRGKTLFLNQRVGCFIPRPDVSAKYYCYLLKEKHILDAVFQYETGTANQGNLGIESIKKTKVQVPPLSKQNEIANFLDRKTGEINRDISTRQSLITKLTEYKKSLIYEVVTGKKEVSYA